MLLINIEPEVLCYRTTVLQVFIRDFWIRAPPMLPPPPRIWLYAKKWGRP